MKKILFIIPMLLLTGCNYFNGVDGSEKKVSSKTQEANKVTKNAPTSPKFNTVYKKIGLAEDIIRPSIENRGFKLEWKAKGKYILDEQDLQVIKGQSLGKALVYFQEKFITRNLKILSQDYSLRHQPYVLIVVCLNKVIVDEYDEKTYQAYRRQIRHSNIDGCLSPDEVFLSDKELKDLNNKMKLSNSANTQNKQPIPQVSGEGALPDFQYSEEDQKPENVDINNLDFGSILVTPEFIQKLEQESGQKFDLKTYLANQERRKLQNK